MTEPNTFGRTIQLFLVDDTPAGLIIASIHGWTGAVLVSTQSTFGRLLARAEVDRTGIYILYGPDPEDNLRMRAYIGEADSVRHRIGDSAGNDKHGFWELAVVVTTSDEALTKGHVRYLEARLIEMTKAAGRVVLDNTQMPDVDRRRLPEADRASMEAFLANLKVVLPIIGLELLKPRPQGSVKVDASSSGMTATATVLPQICFEVRHISGIKAFAVEEESEFVVLEGSESLKDAGYAHNSYAGLKQELIVDHILEPTPDEPNIVLPAPIRSIAHRQRAQLFLTGTPTAEPVGILSAPNLTTTNGKRVKRRPQLKGKRIALRRGRGDSATRLIWVLRCAELTKAGDKSCILEEGSQKCPKPGSRERFNTYRFADHEDNMVKLLMRVTRVSVETMAAMRASTYLR